MPFDPAPFTRAALQAATQHGWKTHRLSPVGKWERPWFQRRSGTPRAPHLYLSAGIHGDEPAGPYAALEILKQPELVRGLDVTIFPLLNPAGLAAGTRENADGIDLNRDYRESKSDEIRSHVEALLTLGRFDLSLCLHEDWETTGVYFYELNLTSRPGCSREIQAAMARHLPIEPRAVIDDFEAVNGIIYRNATHLRQERLDWPEAFYLSHHHTELGYTFETPSKAAPLATRVATQVSGIIAAAAYLKA